MDNRLLVPDTKLDKGSDPYDEKSYAKYDQKQYAPDLMYQEILDFVERSKEKPFALFGTTPVPHVPLQAPKRWIKHYVEKFGDEEPYIGDKGYFPCRYPRATYAAMVSYWDEQIGGLVAKLKELGLYENTLIIFTSDNGPTFNAGSDSPFFDSAKPFKSETGWGKCSLREGGIRVPMITCCPNHIKADSKSDLLSAFWDMMPTMCDIAGVECPPTDGISMLPTMLGEDDRQKKHEFLYWEFPEVGGQKAVRMGNWKAFVKDVRKGNQNIELYDLSVDLFEQDNVATEHPEVIDKVLRIFRMEHVDAEIDMFNLPVW